MQIICVLNNNPPLQVMIIKAAGGRLLLKCKYRCFFDVYDLFGLWKRLFRGQARLQMCIFYRRKPATILTSWTPTAETAYFNILYNTVHT